MKDMGIIAGAAVCAVVGTAALYVAGHHINPIESEICTVESGDYVACQGIVYHVRHSKDHVFVKLFDGAAIDIPFFNFEDEISVGDFLQVEGTVSEYRGNLEIIPEKYTIKKVFYGICADSTLCTAEDVFKVKLKDGICAVTGIVNGDNLIIEDEFTDLLCEFEGVISSHKNRGMTYTFTLVENSLSFSAEHPVKIGEISGFGIRIEDEVVVLYSQWNELPITTIGKAKTMPEGYPVKICGTVESIRVHEGHIFLVVVDSTGSIPIPVFKNAQSHLGVDTHTFCQGQLLTVTGVTTMYQGILEILPEAITCMN